MNSVHKEGITFFDHNNMKIPCIFIKNEIFDEISKACYGKTLAVDADLNILHDDRKNVFVEILLRFSATALKQKVLLYANDNLEFFERLAQSGIIAMASEPHSQASMNIFMVQLPRRDTIDNALELIRSYMK